MFKKKKSGILASTIRQENFKKVMLFGKGEIKLSFFADDTIVYIGNTRDL